MYCESCENHVEFNVAGSLVLNRKGRSVFAFGLLGKKNISGSDFAFCRKETVELLLGLPEACFLM